jgi:hypothetical protein
MMDIEKLRPATRQFIETWIIPEQHVTHEAMRALKRAMSRWAQSGLLICSVQRLWGATEPTIDVCSEGR